MPLTPGLLGTAAFVLVAGVAGGAVIGKVPPMKYLAPDYRLPQAAGSTALSAQAGLPDHYPITTPEGRFEVYELGNRGLDRTARYAPSRYAGYDYPADLAYDAIDEAAQADETGPPVDDRFAVAVEPVALPGPAAADPEPPAPPAVGPPAAATPVLAWGLPRAIDREAELAARP